ncbi:MAG: transglutaminase-like domain-containing protein [Bacteroidota bacterium]
MNKRLLLAISFIFISISSFAVVDTTVGLTAPGNVCGHFQDLSHYLCDGLDGDEAKANAVYNWITHNIKYDIQGMQNIDRDPDKIVEKALKERKAICEGYAMLFTEMCREAGLKAVTLDGYSKDWTSDNGDKLYIPRHAWCAVLINGKWQLADPTWGAGGLVQSPTMIRRIVNKIMRRNAQHSKKLAFRYRYNPGYFMQDPMAFRLKHLPADPMWQLTDTLMPREVFEAGDSAIRKFNGISKLQQNSPELMRVAELEEKQKIFELADRAYKYNSRYPMVLAMKHTFRAMSEIEKAFTDSTVEEGRLLLIDAQSALKRSQEYLAEQKKEFPAHYSELKKKNKAKNQDAKQTQRSLKTGDKRTIAQYDKYSKSAAAKYGKLKAKNAEAKKLRTGIGPTRIAGIETSEREKKTGSRELQIILDSVTARNGRIAAVQSDLDKQHEIISGYEAANKTRMDTLVHKLALADSFLVQEAISRLSMHDNYDDDVIRYNKEYSTVKHHEVDTLQKYYAAYYDSIVARFDARHKLRKQQFGIYTKNIKALEQYRKWNSSDESIEGRYAGVVNEYLGKVGEYEADLKAHAAYLKGNQKIFTALAKQNQKEIKLAAYMDKAEEMRKFLEEKAIEERKRLDTRENEKQKVAIEKARVKLKKISDELN